jgi:hypothetical protein
MLAGNERLIVVVGMAHSGTTILTHVLRQHPEIGLAVNGSEAWILENTWLPLEQADPIQELLTNHTYKRVLLKRPWNSVWHGDWMKQEMPNAKFIYCYRDFEEIAKSWSKPTSFVDERLRNGGVEFQRSFYDMCVEASEAFGRTVPFYRKVYHPGFVENPKAMMAMIATWAGLTHFNFDVSQVGHNKDIKKVLSAVG